jgi:hypothetical protein
MDEAGAKGKSAIRKCPGYGKRRRKTALAKASGHAAFFIGTSGCDETVILAQINDQEADIVRSIALLTATFRWLHKTGPRQRPRQPL